MVTALAAPRERGSVETRPPTLEAIEKNPPIVYIFGVAVLECCERYALAKKPRLQMFFASTKTFRVKVAFATLILYAICILAPSAAFAFGDAIPFCLIEESAPHVHQHASTVHVHADGTSHHHPDSGAAPEHLASHQHADGAAAPEHLASRHHFDGAAASSPQQSNDHETGAPSDCCGLFQITGLASEARSVFAPSAVALRSGPFLTGILRGRGPSRINRPPIS